MCLFRPRHRPPWSMIRHVLEIEFWPAEVRRSFVRFFRVASGVTCRVWFRALQFTSEFGADGTSSETSTGRRSRPDRQEVPPRFLEQLGGGRRQRETRRFRRRSRRAGRRQGAGTRRAWKSRRPGGVASWNRSCPDQGGEGRARGWPGGGRPAPSRRGGGMARDRELA